MQDFLYCLPCLPLVGLALATETIVLASELASAIETMRGIGSLLLGLPGWQDSALVWLDEAEMEQRVFATRLLADRFEYDFSTCPF